MLRVLIVDDEPAARRSLRLLLAGDSEVEVAGECADGREAIDELREQAPDIVLLDVQMPEVDGFEVIRKVGPKRMPVVVFVTAFDEYALRAFEVNAVDYLLKPYSDARFRRSLERAKRQVRQRRSDELRTRLVGLLNDIDAEAEDLPAASAETPAGDGAGAGSQDGTRRFLVRSHGRVVFVNANEIRWVEGAGDYVRLHAEDGSYLTRETMGAMEEALGSAFVRIHRSTLVHLEFLREVRSDSAGHYQAVFQDGTERSLSRSGRERLQEVLGSAL